MKAQNIASLRSFIAIFWLGFFMAISFMEAPLKFNITSITLTQGLAIGRVVFAHLNKWEWFFWLLIVASCFFSRPSFLGLVFISFAGIILILESFWLLPLLDVRAKQIILGQLPEKNDLHTYYVILEILKVPVLLLLVWKSNRSFYAPNIIHQTSCLKSATKWNNYKSMIIIKY